jgi:site-specific recombinase XerD
MWGEAEKRIEAWVPEKREAAKQEAEKQTIPLDTTIEKYLVSCRAERNVREATFRSYKKTLEHLAKFLASVKIAQIKDVEPTHIREFMATRAEYTPRTRRKELEHIRFLFNYAIENQWIAVNPAKPVKIKIPKGGTTLPLSDDEIYRLLEAAEKINNNNQRFVLRARLRAKAMILLMCYTGMRISDTMSLKREDVALDGTIEDHVIVKTKSLLFTNTGELALRALSALPVENEYYFWSGPSESNLTTATGSARRTLYSLSRKTGIDVHPHRFRETFAKKILEETGDIRILQHLLGHASVKTTETSYAHLGEQHKNRLIAALGKVSYLPTLQ